MEEKKKLAGTLVLSFSILCLASAIGYFAYELNGWRRQLPEILQIVSDTSGQIAPVLQNVTEIEHIVPQIIDEVEAVRKTVDNVLSETEKTRNAIPGILADVGSITQQVENTTKSIPGIVDPVLQETAKIREMTPSLLDQVQATNNEVAKVREIVPDILEEVRLTREEIPVLMDRADQLIANADKAGHEAGKGAVSGVIRGIISAPFGVVGGIGQGVTDLFGTEVGNALTEEDIKIFREKIIELAENGKEGDVATWRNRKTSNSGTMTLLKKYMENNQECRQVKVDVKIKKKDAPSTMLSGCKQKDGSWVAIQ